MKYIEYRVSCQESIYGEFASLEEAEYVVAKYASRFKVPKYEFRITKRIIKEEEVGL